MTLTRKPAVAESQFSDRSERLQIANIRQRLEAIEGAFNTLEGQANQSSFTLSKSNAATSSLQSQITQILNDLDVLDSLLQQDNGLAVLSDGALITRVLEAGSGIAIADPDGHDGNPVISTTGSGSYPFLTTELDDDLLTESGHRVRVES